MQLVFRVEHEHNVAQNCPTLCEGPYNFRYAGVILTDTRGPKAHPSPQEENVSMWSEHYCAFADKDQFLNWFSVPMRRSLKEEGFVLRTYKAEKVVVTPTQCLIDTNFSVVRVDTIDLMARI